MFTIDQKITDLKIRDKNLFKVFFSMNSHQVAAPDMSLQDARSYVFFLREERGRISAYIGLHFLHADRKLFYTHSDNPFPDSQLPDVEDEARHFAEDLGAMLDEIDFSTMSDLEKDRWIDEQEIVAGRKTSVDTPSARVAQPAPGPHSDQTEQNAPALPRPQPVPPTEQPLAAPPQRVTPVQPGLASEAAIRQTLRAQKRRPATPAPQGIGAISAAETEQTAPLQPANDVLEQAVKAGIVKAPKAQLRRDIRSAGGVVSRDKEALARLLSSF